MRGITVAVSAIAVLGLTPVASAGAAAAASDPTGIWINNTGRGAIEIKPCGDKLCGKVVWVKSDADAKGCGKQIIGDVVAAGGGHWGNGWIYSPERGRKYNVELTPLANGTLRVTGYAGLRFLSKTMIWKRASSSSEGENTACRYDQRDTAGFNSEKRRRSSEDGVSTAAANSFEGQRVESGASRGHSAGRSDSIG